MEPPTPLNCATNNLRPSKDLSLFNSSMATFNNPHILIPNMKEPSKPLIMVNIPNPITLTSTNYLSWKTQIESILIGYDLYTHLDPKFPAPPATITSSNNNTSVPNPAYQTWFRQDKLIFGALIGTLSSDFIPLISQSKSVHEMWNTLHERHAPQPKLRDRNRISTECEVIDLEQLTTPSSSTIKSSNQKRKKINEDKMKMDAISNLPNDILVYLLSFVDMKTAGRTSILSKKWKYVWAYLSNLDFQDPKIVMETDKNKIRTELGKYCNWVNKVTTVHGAPYLNFMRIHFPDVGSDSSYFQNVNKWVEFALWKNVVNLELNLACVNGDCNLNPCMSVPGFVNPIRIFTFKSTHLKSLHLENVPMYGALVEKVLSNCPNLEHLTIKGCMLRTFSCLFFSTDVDGKIGVYSPNLKYLEFYRCQYVTSLKIIYAPKLTSLVLITMNMVEMEYTCVSSSLVGVTFDITHCYRVFRNVDLFPGFSFSQLGKLSIHWHLGVQASLVFPDLSIENLIVLIPIIEACPLLHTFNLELCYMNWEEKGVPTISTTNSKDIEMYNARIMQAHQHLKVVKIVGFDGNVYVAKLVLCLSHHMHTPMLNKIILDPHYPQFEGKLHELYNVQNSTKIGLARMRAKMLANRIRGGVDVLIL